MNYKNTQTQFLPSVCYMVPVIEASNSAQPRMMVLPTRITQHAYFF